MSTWVLNTLVLGVSAIMRYINRRFTYLLTYSCVHCMRPCLPKKYIPVSAWSGPIKKPGLSRNPRSSAPPHKFLIYFWSENGEFWCIFGGILCDLELQESKQETRYRPGKSNGAGSPTLATRHHFKPWFQLRFAHPPGAQRIVHFMEESSSWIYPFLLLCWNLYVITTMLD